MVADNRCPTCGQPYPTLAQREAQRKAELAQREWVGFESRPVPRNAHGTMTERPKRREMP